MLTHVQKKKNKKKKKKRKKNTTIGIVHVCFSSINICRVQTNLFKHEVAGPSIQNFPENRANEKTMYERLCYSCIYMSP